METKLTISVYHLKKALTVLRSVINSKNAHPILGSVIFRHDKDKDFFTVTSSDGDNWLTLECIDNEGVSWINIVDSGTNDKFEAMAIDLTMLKNYIDLLPSDIVVQVFVDNNKHELKIDYQCGFYIMPFSDAFDFPISKPVVKKGSPECKQREKITEEINKLESTQETNEQGEVVMSAELAELYRQQSNIAEPLCRFVLPSDDFLSYLNNAVESTATDELRPVIGGVCLDVSHEGIVVVASDGHQLYKNKIEKGMGWLEYSCFPAYDEKNDKIWSEKIVVSKKTIKILLAAISKGDVTVSIDKMKIEFCANGMLLTCSLIDGRFPNYESIIPKESPYKINVNRNELLQGLRRLRLSANETSDIAVLSRDNDMAVIKSNNSECSRAGQEQISLNENDFFLPEDFSIGFKITMAISILSRIKTDNVLIYFSDKSRPIIYYPDDVNSSLLMLQMPMMV